MSKKKSSMQSVHCTAFAFLFTVITSLWTPALGQEKKKFDWRSDWELADGLNMEIDSQGYSYPTQIAFVPQPGAGPKDPLYFVIELKGKVKVVTNDRTIYTFAKDFLPNPQGETFVPTGAAGLCLDPKNGYVFATFAYLDDTNIYRNGMVRFSSAPGQFGIAPEETKFFLDLFKSEVAAGGHTVGPCQIKEDLLYVTVGYGQSSSSSLNVHATNGSILRMTTDFKPVSENPFYTDDGKDTAVDYIWAYGFRNPFGLKMVGNRLFATENGGSIDRFNEIIEGESYFSNGTDWSIGARAAQVFAPSIGIAHLDFIPEDSELFPELFRGIFVAAAAGGPGAKGPGTEGRRSVLMWKYDFEKQRMAGVPRHLLRFRGEGMQLPVSVALGPDALYFTALIPNAAGNTPVYRITYNPAANYPYKPGTDKSPQALINRFGCRQCHKIKGEGGTAGPPLNSKLAARLLKKLNKDDYKTRVAEVEKIDAEPFRSFRKERADILALNGEERVTRWLPVYLRQPNFDNPKVQMPAMGLSVAEAESIASYLIKTATRPKQEFSTLDRIRFAVSRSIPDLRYRHLVISFLLGGAVMLILGWLFSLIKRRRRSS